MKSVCFSDSFINYKKIKMFQLVYILITMYAYTKNYNLQQRINFNS